jgi:MFS transporter, OFA family, oxalate/formate antiporter
VLHTGRRIVEMTLSGIPAAARTNRWWQLVWGLICMMAISSTSYVWTLFTTPLTAHLNATLAEVQVTYSVFVVLNSFLAPFQGYLVDAFGPRMLLSLGAVLSGASWVLAAAARSPIELWLTYGVLGGIGTGIIYVGVVGLMARWFPDRRGLACGIVVAGFGMGAIITTYPIAVSITQRGYQQTLIIFGMIFGLAALFAAQGIKRPPARTGDALVSEQTAADTPAMMLRSPIFWVMFAMMVMTSTSGLMVISQIAPLAKEFGVADATVFGIAALPLALMIDRFTNGLTRPFFGWVSDLIGREQTMCLAFGLEGAAMFVWFSTRETPLLFVLLSGVVFFGWGEIFSLFPSTLTDTFGARHATTNYGFLYTAVGIGSVFAGPLAAWLREATGSWVVAFSLIIVLDLLAAMMAITVLKPMRERRRLENSP